MQWEKRWFNLYLSACARHEIGCKQMQNYLVSNDLDGASQTFEL